MRIAGIGPWLCAGVVLVTATAVVLPGVGFAQRPLTAAPSGGAGVIAMATTTNDHQQLTVVDPETRALAVYHIDLSSGEVALKSVRRIDADLRLDEFNGTVPSPRDVRAMVNQR